MEPQRDALGALTVIGDLVEDVVVWTRGVVHAGTDNPAEIHRSRGGSAANVAAFAARSVPTRFVGRVGEDRVAEFLVADLAAQGVDVRVSATGRTGTVVVLVDEAGERTMFPDRATAAELDEIPDEALEGTSVLHVPAYGLAVDPMASAILDAVDRTRAASPTDRPVTVSIDVSAVTLVEQLGPDRFDALLERLAPELVFANAEEAQVARLAERRPWGAFVIKDGPRPARVITTDRTVDVMAVPVRSVRDTTGAGDAFAAGFLAAWMSDRDPRRACQAGHRTAAAILSTPGATARPPATH